MKKTIKERAESPSICDICEKPFDRVHPLQKRHQGECTRIYDLRAAKARWRRSQERKGVPSWKKPTICACSNTFIPRNSKQTTCGKCKKASADWRKPRVCEGPGCGETFTPIRPNQVTCCRRCGKNRENKIARGKEKWTVNRSMEAVDWPMPDPFPLLTTLPPGVVSWYEPSMMPVG